MSFFKVILPERRKVLQDSVCDWALCIELTRDNVKLLRKILDTKETITANDDGSFSIGVNNGFPGKAYLITYVRQWDEDFGVYLLKKTEPLYEGCIVDEPNCCRPLAEVVKAAEATNYPCISDFIKAIPNNRKSVYDNVRIKKGARPYIKDPSYSSD